MKKRKLILGSRGSRLALIQAEQVKKALLSQGTPEIEIRVIKTTGDTLDEVTLRKIDGKGFFTKELEQALLSREIDLAVHSLKDLMTRQPEGLTLGAVCFREDRRELLVMRKEVFGGEGVLPIRPGSVIGTGSARRQCQIAFHNPSLRIKDIRGNVPTRVEKLRKGEYDGIIVAAAGIRRLELNLLDLNVVPLDAELFLPAPGQGLLGIQIREDDTDVKSLVAALELPREYSEARLERGLLSKFDAGCSLPLGVYAQADSSHYRLKAVLGTRENERWTGVRQADVRGTSIEKVIDEVFSKLTE